MTYHRRDPQNRPPAGELLPASYVRVFDNAQRMFEQRIAEIRQRGLQEIAQMENTVARGHIAMRVSGQLREEANRFIIETATSAERQVQQLNLSPPFRQQVESEIAYNRQQAIAANQQAITEIEKGLIAAVNNPPFVPQPEPKDVGTYEDPIRLPDPNSKDPFIRNWAKELRQSERYYERAGQLRTYVKVYACVSAAFILLSIIGEGTNELPLAIIIVGIIGFVLLVMNNGEIYY